MSTMMWSSFASLNLGLSLIPGNVVAPVNLIVGCFCFGMMVVSIVVDIVKTVKMANEIKAK